MNEQPILTTKHDVMPNDESVGESELQTSPGGSTGFVVPPPKKKGILASFVDDVLHGGDITAKKAEKQRVLQEAQARATQIDAELAKLESDAIETARQSSPEYKAQQKQARQMRKAYYDEARRMVALILIADDYIRRYPDRIDQQLISWCDGILHNYHLHGFFSKPEGK